jgi:hypothetical protein
MARMFVEAPVTPGFSLSEAAQYLMAELDKTAAQHGRRVGRDVTIYEGAGAFGERVLRVEAPVH